jgi:hypothetical protein
MCECVNVCVHLCMRECVSECECVCGSVNVSASASASASGKSGLGGVLVCIHVYVSDSIIYLHGSILFGVLPV